MTLELPHALVTELLEHSQSTLPHECVGLLFTKGGIVRRQPLPNVAPQPERAFFAEPQSLLEALLSADRAGEKLLALYHSHPVGSRFPSRTDLQEARYGVPGLIILPLSGVLSAFRLEENSFEELDVIVYR